MPLPAYRSSALLHIFPISSFLLRNGGKLSKWLPHQPWYREAVKWSGMEFPTDPSKHVGIFALELLCQSQRRFNPAGVTADESPFKELDARFEPPWMARLPFSAKRHLRTQYVFTEAVDPFAIVPLFPFMGFGYVLPDSDMVPDASDTFRLGRLRGVKQLSFIKDPYMKEADRSIASSVFEHTRFCHSLDVYAVANLIAENTGLTGTERSTLLTAAISHDALTPAGGDSVKLIDPKAFDEDAHYPELLEGPSWESYTEKYSIDRELLIDTIGGNGFLGRILDISDKSSYLARDAYAYLGSAAPRRDARDANLFAVADIVTNDPYVCSVWESAHRYDGSLAFGNSERFARFLTLRALMFRGLYYNPYSRFFEYLIGNGVVKYLYRNGLVTRRELLEHSDEWIEHKIDEAVDSDFVIRRMNHLEHARIEEYPDLHSAARRQAELESDDSVLAIVDDFKPVTNPGTRKFMVRKGSRALVFAEACPEAAGEIEDIMRFSKLVRVFVFATEDLGIPKKSRRKVKDMLKSVA